MGDFCFCTFHPGHSDHAPPCAPVIHCAVDHSSSCLYNRTTWFDLERYPNSEGWHIFGTRGRSWILVLALRDLFLHSPVRGYDLYSSVLPSEEGPVSQAKHPPADCSSHSLAWKFALCIWFISHPPSGYHAVCFYD